MNTYILLLRGINVGGHRKLLMADLKALLEALDLVNIYTYIQSGNVVFQTKTEINISEFEVKITEQIHSDYKYDVPTIIIPLEKFESIIDSNPFVETTNNIKDLNCTFFRLAPDIKLIDDFNSLNLEPDKFLVTHDVTYLRCDLGYADTKLTHSLLEKKLKVSCTTRNWKTTLKLFEIAKKLAE